MKTPPAVTKAFQHIRTVLPMYCIEDVTFFPDGTWLYFDTEHETPSFGKFGTVDVGILEDAQRAVEEKFDLPVSFHFRA